MSEERVYKLRQAMQEFNLGLDSIVEFLQKNGSPIERSPVAKLTAGEVELLRKEYSSSAQEKKEASGISIGHKHNEKIVIEGDSHKDRRRNSDEDMDEAPIARRNLQSIPGIPNRQAPAPAPVQAKPEPVVVPAPSEPAPEPEIPSVIKAEGQIQGLKVLGKIDLSGKKKASAPKPAAEPEPEKIEKPQAKVEVPKPEPEPTPAEPIAAPAPEPSPEVKKAKTVKAVEPVEAVEPVAKPEPEAVKAEPTPAPVPVVPEVDAPAVNKTIRGEADQLKGLTVLGKIDLKVFENKPKSNEESESEKRKRKRLKTGPVAVGGSSGAGNRPAQGGEGGFRQGGPGQRSDQPGGQQNQGQGQQGQGGGYNRGPGQGGGQNRPGGGPGGPGAGQNRPGGGPGGPGAGQNRPGGGGGQGRPGGGGGYSNRQISGKVNATMNKGLGKALKKKNRDRNERYGRDDDQTSRVLKLSEFVSVADLASLMDVSVNQVIATCMSLGMFVSINQRLDAEALTIIADEFGFETSFNSAEEEENVIDTPDNDDELETRAPIVTIMGHVDHGKTSLLDYIRKTKVVASEAGGITQHIGAYNVRTESGRNVTFLDTPGHEAFTAMRARGAKVTDVVIIVVAADDSVMPQTKEAINHAQIAGVPIVIAINKIDKAGANPEKIKEALANLNILVEDWGGKYQCQEISAKKGLGISELLEKVVLESDILDLKANPNKMAQGTVIEASLDKGRGYVSTMLVQAGTLNVGDFILCGAYYGKVKAMYDDTGARIDAAGPSTPVQVLGLNNAPQAGDKFNVMENEREAKELANKREQIQREQSIRTKKHITIDEIGRRIALGTFKELNLIIKGDVDGSVEALADSLQKLSTNEVAIRILHKGVGQISEADVMLASASDAIILGFQVRPSAQARRQAENEEIEIKLYSIIYDAINDIKDAMEGLLAPKIEEVIVGNIEIREVFKISKLGNIAGCYVTDGYVKRNNGIRVIRDGIVIHTGNLEALKRFKDDVSEVKFGYECGLKVKNFNNIEVGDTIESFEERETKRTL
jgi:translation initiation factor IF-2